MRSDQTFCFGYWETESDVGPTSAAPHGATAHLVQRLRTWALEPRSRFKSCFHHMSAMKLASCSVSLGLFLICKTRTTTVPASRGCCEDQSRYIVGAQQTLAIHWSCMLVLSFCFIHSSSSPDFACAPMSSLIPLYSILLGKFHYAIVIL